MTDYDTIMEAIVDGDISRLGEIALMFDDFPKGKDDFLQRYWITNAIDCGKTDVVRWMLNQGAPVIFRDDEGYTVLHSALERKSTEKYEMMRVLIAHGADVNAHGPNDWTPAHQAAARNDVPALKILKEAGADFSIRTRIDWYATPLEEVIHLRELSTRDAGDMNEAIAFLQTCV